MQIKAYQTYDESQKPVYDALFNLTRSLVWNYPKYKNWFYGTFVAGLKKGERLYLMAQENDRIVGCTFLKNAPDEKKLSTIYVVPDYRKKGLGQSLMRESLKILGSGVVLSVSDKNLSDLQPLLEKFSFQKTHEKTGVYLPDMTEHYYIKK